MVVFAHPDDAEFTVGGTVAKWAREGTEVAYVCVTDGGAGSNEPGRTREEIRRVREAELREACAVLGVKECSILGFPDGAVEPTLEVRRAITREVRRFRPTVLVAPDPTRFWDHERTYVNHPDHRAVGVACMAVINPDAPTRPQFPELLEEGLEPYEVPFLWIPAFDADADTFVDIADTIDLKVEALRCHRSQLQGWPVEEWVRRRAKERGAARGLQYAEAFRTFRLRDRGEPDEDE